MLTQEELDRDYLDSPGAAKVLNISPARIRKLCSLGRFEGALKLGTSGWLIPRQSVENYTRLARGPKSTSARRAEDEAFLKAKLEESKIDLEEKKDG